MLAIRSVDVGVGECQSDDSLSVLVRNQKKKRAYAPDFLRDRKKTRKGKVPEQSTEFGERRRAERDGC